MTNVSIQLPTTPVLIRTVGGEPIRLDFAKLPVNIVGELVVAGAKIILTNTFNGGGKDATEQDKRAQLEKKMAAWYKGEFNVVARGESAMTALRNQYIDERRAATNATQAEVEKQIKATVASVFGKDESATFSRFLDAVATLKAKAKGEQRAVADIRAEIEDGLAKRADEAEQARAKARAELTVDVADLGL